MKAPVITIEEFRRLEAELVQYPNQRQIAKLETQLETEHVKLRTLRDEARTAYAQLSVGVIGGLLRARRPSLATHLGALSRAQKIQAKAELQAVKVRQLEQALKALR